MYIPVLSFRRNQKQELNFQQVGDLVTRNISVFYLQRVVLYFKGMLNSIDFYKRIFLHVILSLIIAPWSSSLIEQNLAQSHLKKSKNNTKLIQLICATCRLSTTANYFVIFYLYWMFFYPITGWFLFRQKESKV